MVGLALTVAFVALYLVWGGAPGVDELFERVEKLANDIARLGRCPTTLERSTGRSSDASRATGGFAFEG